MQDGCKVYMNPTLHRVDHVSWSLGLFLPSKKHLLEAGLTQNRDTMALQTLTIVELFYFIMCEDHINSLT